MQIRQIIPYVLDIVLLSYSLYFLFFVVVGTFTRKTSKIIEPRNRFAIVIPAHNEEKVIANLISNLRKMDYPAELYDIFVVVDNCSDNTLAIVKKLNVNYFTRINHDKKGKGYALSYGFRQLGFFDGSSGYDAAVVFDADNLVEPNFLKVMNTRLENNEELIQSYVDAKNPADNWVTATFAMMFWINDRFNLMARYNISLSAVLMGTGMCISARVLNEIGWDTVTLTEDLEYSIQALGQGISTAFARETRIYDEKPVSFRASCRQRLRWARGQLSVIVRYIPGLLKKGIKTGSIRMIDGSLRLFQQPYMMFYFAIAVLRIIFPQYLYSPLLRWVMNNLKLFSIVLPVVPYLIPASVFILDNISFKSFKYIIFFPLFMYSWVLILYWGLLTLNKEDWLPTKHFRQLEIENMPGDYQ